jgi:SAM-dependent methyltransferase
VELAARDFERIVMPQAVISKESHNSYDPSYFSPLFAIEDKHFWFRSRNNDIVTLVKPLIAKLNSDYKILEIGCGTGNVLKELEKVCKPGSLFGMDLFSEGLAFARRRVSCPLVQGDLHRPPFNTKFDLIGLFDVIEHLPDDIQVLQDLRAMLKPGGALLLTVPAHPALWSYFDTASHHFRRYTLKELETKLVETGYEVEYLSQYMTILFPAVWLGRRLSGLLGRLRKQPDPAAQTRKLMETELRIIPGLNKLLLIALSWEKLLLKRHLRLPLGTSLIVVARNKKLVN